MSQNPSLADEALGIFKDFLGELGPMSKRVANDVEAGIPTPTLGRLIDGLGLVNESIAQLQMALSLQGQELTMSVNEDLRAIVRDLLESTTSGDMSSRVEILRNRLPEHIETWKQVSIRNPG